MSPATPFSEEDIIAWLIGSPADTASIPRECSSHEAPYPSPDSPLQRTYNSFDCISVPANGVWPPSPGTDLDVAVPIDETRARYGIETAFSTFLLQPLRLPQDTALALSYLDHGPHFLGSYPPACPVQFAQTTGSMCHSCNCIDWPIRSHLGLKSFEQVIVTRTSAGVPASGPFSMPVIYGGYAIAPAGASGNACYRRSREAFTPSWETAAGRLPDWVHPDGLASTLAVLRAE